MRSKETKKKKRKKADIEAAISKARAWAESREIRRLSQSGTKGGEVEISNNCKERHDGSGKNRCLEALKEMLEIEEDNVFKANLKIEMIMAQIKVEENK